VERSLRESRAVDVEALCVQAGRRVWNLVVDIRVLNDGGNMTDACGIAALGSLCAYRRPDVTINADAPGGIIIHPTSERESVPLTIHHLPFPVTFAFFGDSNNDDGFFALDPLAKEEAAASGTFTVVMNSQREICATQKAHGIGVSQEQVLGCFRIALERAVELEACLRSALEVHSVARVAARVKRHVERGRKRHDTTPSQHHQMPPAGENTVEIMGGEGDAAAADALARLPDDIRRFVEHAAADADGDDLEDSSSSDADTKGTSDHGEEEEEEDDDDNDEIERDIEEGGDERSLACEGVEAPPMHLPETESKQKLSSLTTGMGNDRERSAQEKRMKKRVKLRRVGEQQESMHEDQYAAIAEIIAGAGRSTPLGVGGDGLECALKRKS